MTAAGVRCSGFVRFPLKRNPVYFRARVYSNPLGCLPRAIDKRNATGYLPSTKTRFVRHGSSSSCPRRVWMKFDRRSVGRFVPIGVCRYLALHINVRIRRTSLVQRVFGKHVVRAKSIMDRYVVQKGEPQSQVLEHLGPESFHRRIRGQLRYLFKALFKTENANEAL